MAIDLCNSNSVSESDPFRISKTMEASSVRVLNSSVSVLLKHRPLKYPLFRLPYINNNPFFPVLPCSPCTRIVATSASPNFPNPSHSSIFPAAAAAPPSSAPRPNFRSFQSLSTSTNNFAPPTPTAADSGSSKPFEWKMAQKVNGGGDVGVVGGKGPVVTVVLLGWLGAKRRYLRRYVEMYNQRGFNAVTLVTSVNDVLASDNGRKLEERLAVLAQELASWLADNGKDGRQRRLIFHTFSNTGWLA